VPKARTHEHQRRALDHVGVTVDNLERSLAFYCDLLGLDIIEVSEGHNGSVVGLPEARMRIADVATGDGTVLELIEYTAERSAPSPPAHNAPGCAHIGMRVADLDATLDTLGTAGTQPAGEPMLVVDGLAWAGTRIAYVRDPDGSLIELVQRPAEW
jgi:catechol 2,3-dioxygenase-like lactoylglutathione lyase family enzyme